MATDKNRKELNIGDHVLYVSNPPAKITLRGIVKELVSIGSARCGEKLYLADVDIEFINKTPAKPGQTIRVWSGDLIKYDAEKTTFI